MQRSSDPIERAYLATAAREADDALDDASIAEANRAGITWRDIGARLAVRSASRRDADIEGDA